MHFAEIFVNNCKELFKLCENMGFKNGQEINSHHKPIKGTICMHRIPTHLYDTVLRGRWYTSFDMQLWKFIKNWRKSILITFLFLCNYNFARSTFIPQIIQCIRTARRKLVYVFIVIYNLWRQIQPWVSYGNPGQQLSSCFDNQRGKGNFP